MQARLQHLFTRRAGYLSESKNKPDLMLLDNTDTGKQKEDNSPQHNPFEHREEDLQCFIQGLHTRILLGSRTMDIFIVICHCLFLPSSLFQKGRKVHL